LAIQITARTLNLPRVVEILSNPPRSAYQAAISCPKNRQITNCFRQAVGHVFSPGKKDPSSTGCTSTLGSEGRTRKTSLREQPDHLSSLPNKTHCGDTKTQNRRNSSQAAQEPSRGTREASFGEEGMAISAGSHGSQPDYENCHCCLHFCLWNNGDNILYPCCIPLLFKRGELAWPEVVAFEPRLVVKHAMAWRIAPCNYPSPNTHGVLILEITI
jgi:hypothetical protein